MNYASFPKVYIILLNWNAWADSIECLESIYRSDYPNFKVIVCDNDSHDGSMEYLKSWANGEIDKWMPTEKPMRSFSHPPISKPIRYIELDRQCAEMGLNLVDDQIELILIQTGANLGFAGGNNVGARFALKQDDFGYIWFLNNDTVIEPEALSQLVERMREKPNAGICGSELRYYETPEDVQASGGAKYNKISSSCYDIKFLPQDKNTLNLDIFESKMDYIVGASMFVSNSFLENVGLMSEDYFLFFEEIDWAVRARKKQFSLAYAEKSIVYHKGGLSTGSSYKASLFSYSADYWINRARLLFVRKYYPALLPFLYLRFLAAIVNRIRRKQFDRIRMILGLMINTDLRPRHIS